MRLVPRHEKLFECRCRLIHDLLADLLERSRTVSADQRLDIGFLDLAGERVGLRDALADILLHALLHLGAVMPDPGPHVHNVRASNPWCD